MPGLAASCSATCSSTACRHPGMPACRPGKARIEQNALRRVTLCAMLPLPPWCAQRESAAGQIELPAPRPSAAVGLDPQLLYPTHVTGVPRQVLPSAHAPEFIAQARQGSRHRSRHPSVTMSSPVHRGFDVSASSADAACWQGPTKLVVRRSMLTALLLSNEQEYDLDYTGDSECDCDECCGQEPCCQNQQARPCSPGSQPIDIPRSP